jgi:hypothetical protein
MVEHPVQAGFIPVRIIEPQRNEEILFCFTPARHFNHRSRQEIRQIFRQQAGQVCCFYCFIYNKK